MGKILAAIPIVLFSFLIYLCTPYVIRELKQPKPGEVWRYTPRRGTSPNPFRDTSYRYLLKPYYDYKVIDVKDGYVLYMDLADSSKESSTVHMFKVGAKVIKKEP